MTNIPIMKSSPDPLFDPKGLATPYCFPGTPPHAAFWDGGTSWAATSRVKFISPITKWIGRMDGMDDGGISKRSEVQFHAAPGIAFTYAAKKPSARANPNRHDASGQVSCKSKKQSIPEVPESTIPAVELEKKVRFPFVAEVALMPQ